MTGVRATRGGGWRGARARGLARGTTQIDNGMTPVNEATIPGRGRRGTLKHGSPGPAPAPAHLATRHHVSRDVDSNLTGPGIVS
jgi:hypothetical protein